MSDGLVNAAVVGVGRMGQHHARNYNLIDGFKLVGVVDTNPENAQRAGQVHKCRAFTSVAELLHAAQEAGTPVHCASVAVPTVYHRAVAEQLLPAGVDVLIEKPLSPTVEDGRAIVELAKRHGRVLQVGHTERFNPVYRALKKYQLTPAFVEVHRISPMTFRSIDVGVVLDMMMPRMGGFPVLEHFRDKRDAPPIIMITANEGSRHKAYAEWLGVVSYIRKPFAMEELMEQVEAGLAAAEAAKQEPEEPKK